MLRKGFTLIELLIVITIIAILAGAAIPYVQDYVEDARIATAKADMNEIKNALTRYELDRGVKYTDTTITALVGAYLGKAISDPWGVPYEIDSGDCQVRSYGPNRVKNDISGGNTYGGYGDDINVDFRAPLAVTKAYFVDTDNNASVSTGDSIRVRFSRPASVGAVTAAGWGYVVNGATVVGANMATTSATDREAVITFSGIPAAFIPGRDAIYLIETSLIKDTYTPSPAKCNGNQIAIKSLK